MHTSPRRATMCASGMMPRTLVSARAGCIGLYACLIPQCPHISRVEGVHAAAHAADGARTPPELPGRLTTALRELSPAVIAALDHWPRDDVPGQTM